MAITEIISALVSGPIKTMLDEFHLSPEKKAEIAAQQAEALAKAAQADRDLEAKLAEIQGQNIRAETQSEDPYVRRARPTFLYLMIVAIGANLVVFPLVNAAMGHGFVMPFNIPDMYLELFGAGFLGYTGARSWEKLKVGK